MSRVAVNRWAANPLAKELYGGRKLSPGRCWFSFASSHCVLICCWINIWFMLLVLAWVGFLEPSLKVRNPSELVVMELLMSENPDACFALARPFRWSLPNHYMWRLLPVACHSTLYGFSTIWLEIQMLNYIPTGNVLFETISPEIWRNCWKLSLNCFRKWVV